MGADAIKQLIDRIDFDVEEVRLREALAWQNPQALLTALAPHEEQLILPRTIEGADPSWFGVPMTLREGDAAERRALQLHLLERSIDSRLMLGGNMTRQPGYLDLDLRIVGELTGADKITESSIWVGCGPTLTDEMVDWIAEAVISFLQR